MKSKKEMIQARIPVNNEWDNDELAAKAKELGMNKSEFIVKAVDFFVNFDSATYLKLDIHANSLHIPLWLYIQNKLIKEMAQTAAELEVGKTTSKIVDDYILFEDEEGPRVLTGMELFNELKELYSLSYKSDSKK